MHPLPSLGVIIVAAGRGERLGSTAPKAFVELDDRPLLEYALRTVTALEPAGQLVVVIPEGFAAETLEIVDGVVTGGSAWQVSIETGGRERDESVRNGLSALHDSIDTVLVHDAARPLTPASVFDRVISEVRRTGDGVVPTIPVADTLKRIDSDGTVLVTEDRTHLAAAQTPQGFPRESLEAAHESAQSRMLAGGETMPTDDAEVLQRFGGKVRTVDGDPMSHKVTSAADLKMLHGILSSGTQTTSAQASGIGQPS